ncbi:MAG: hypothetical protein DRQ49_18635 [Gammaproteobacteria bacterium]|nr:MAG: hypothetical protein DRQ49_18635 [Gammaproteobacteria bacterium]RKZ40099.1 MAG: hypothetical protein DRQ41_09825 [Gammaproteobacteria bacterium]RKZ76298.1 MAG: hypothetical protein DRQ57_04470 [Gammaproteobacteria bacterium]
MYPILFKIGDYTIYTYGFVMVCAFIICITLVLKSFPKEILSYFDIYNFCLITLVSLLIGNKLIALFMNGDFSLQSFMAIFKLWEKSNLGTYPSLLFAMSLILLYCKVRNIPVLPTLDFLLPYVVLGIAIQRTFGCFSAGCCHGSPTDMPWGFYFPEASPAGSAFLNVSIHPTQIYYGLSTLSVYYLLIILERRLKKIKGAITVWAMIGISGTYFMVSFFRGDMKKIMWQLTNGQFISLAVFILSIVLLIYLKYDFARNKLSTKEDH